MVHIRCHKPACLPGAVRRYVIQNKSVLLIPQKSRDAHGMAVHGHFLARVGRAVSFHHRVGARSPCHGSKILYRTDDGCTGAQGQRSRQNGPQAALSAKAAPAFFRRSRCVRHDGGYRCGGLLRAGEVLSRSLLQHAAHKRLLLLLGQRRRKKFQPVDDGQQCFVHKDTSFSSKARSFLRARASLVRTVASGRP